MQTIPGHCVEGYDECSRIGLEGIFTQTLIENRTEEEGEAVAQMGLPGANKGKPDPQPACTFESIHNKRYHLNNWRKTQHIKKF